VIELTAMRPGPAGPVPTTARYDEKARRWLVEDASWYRALKSLRLPDLAYYPDEALSLVEYAAQLYHGTVRDLREPQPPAVPGTVY